MKRKSQGTARARPRGVISIGTVKKKDTALDPYQNAAGSETVLVAEDDPVSRKLLENRLRLWGYHVIFAENGAQAWALLQQKCAADLLILDWMMPEVDGIELCRRIRENLPGPYRYIILVSGKDEKRDVVSGLEAGADDYVAKPFDVEELRARLRAGRRILSLQKELIQVRDALEFQATHDALTGLWSRGALLELLETELERGKRLGGSTGLLMLDLDHFKSINDKYGHLVGDVVLKETARRILGAVRPYDFVGRYGGEEFVAVLSSCDSTDASAVAERVRSVVNGESISTFSGCIPVTVSIGCVVALQPASGLEMLAAADAALYEAKRGGRNQVVSRTFGSSNSGDQGVHVLEKSSASGGF